MAAAASSAKEVSGGGVGRWVGGVVMRELGVRRRFVILRNGFSSTLRRRDLCRASVSIVSVTARILPYPAWSYLLRPDQGERRSSCCGYFSIYLMDQQSAKVK